MDNVVLLEVLALSGFMSMVAAFMLLLAYKVGIVEWLQVHGNEMVSKMAHCDFCMSWWLCVLLTAIVIVFVCEPYVLAVPFIATPLTRHWL